MKICHMTSAHDSYDTRIFQKECVSLAKVENFSVYLVAQGDSRVEKNVEVIGIGKKPNSRVKRALSFSKEIYKTSLKIDADIYHFHDPELLFYAKKLKKLGKIVIFDCHENMAEQIKVKSYIPAFLRMLISKLYRKYELSVINKIDAVIYPCTENGVTPFDKIDSNLILIDNYPIMDNFTTNDEVHKVYDICCAGSLTEERGIIELLEAVNISNSKLVLAGEFSSEALKDKLIEKGLMKNVEFKGMCTLEEIKTLLNQSKLVVSNIHNVGQYFITDNLPTKVYEAMAMRLPVILSSTKYNRFLTAQYNFGVCVDPKDSVSIGHEINNILHNPSFANKLGNNGRKLIEERFSWEKEEKKLVNLYKEFEI